MKNLQGKLRPLLASEGLVASGLPPAVQDHVTVGGRFKVLHQDGGNVLTDGGGHFKSGMKFAAYKFSDLDKAAKGIEEAKESGKQYVPIMKTFPSKKAAMDWLQS